MSQRENFLHYIADSRIRKRNTIQINLPTYNSYQTTKKLIGLLLNQKNISFDILLIDDGSGDCRKLLKIYPFLNYILLKKNTGTSGAYRIGMEVALREKYEYVICTDNDAILLENDALSRLFKKIKEDRSLGCVAPNHCDNPLTQDVIRKKQLPYHYLFIRCSVLKKIELHNFYHFLITDDIAFTSKLISKSKILLCHDILYHHDPFKPKYLQNQSLYLGVRGFLIILFLEKDISFSLKLYHFFHFFYYPAICILHSIKFRDSSYISTMFSAIHNFFLNYKKLGLGSIPKNKYVLVETNQSLKKASQMNLTNSLWMKKKYYVYSNYYKRKLFFKLTHAD